MKYLQKIDSKKDILGVINLEDVNFNNFNEFDYYRIVNPITKSVYSYKNNKLEEYDDYKCYNIWGTGVACKYCVSTDALVTKTTRRKLEQIEGELFLAKVFPVTINDETLVIELFQNIGDSYVKTKLQNHKLSHIINSLNDMASIDSFTGLLSHGFMYNKLHELCRENKLPLAMACLDIDNMKLVNDTYGHYAGDELIHKISSELIKLSKDENIFAGRTGGDEFQVIFDGYSKEQALALSSDIFQSLDGIAINPYYNAGVSWAIEEREDKQSAKDFMNFVDKKMYQCKLNRHTRR